MTITLSRARAIIDAALDKARADSAQPLARCRIDDSMVACQRQTVR